MFGWIGPIRLSPVQRLGATGINTKWAGSDFPEVFEDPVTQQLENIDCRLISICFHHGIPEELISTAKLAVVVILNGMLGCRDL